MKSNRIRARRLATAAMLVVLGVSSVQATPWSFGIIADTQDTVNLGATGTNTVATNIIAAVNQQFVAKGVDFAVQVGDLTDTGTNAGLQTRLDINSTLNAAGIPFYALRGNHESSAAAQTFFQTNFIPTSSAAATVSKAPDDTTYSVTYKNTKLVLMDINTATSTTTMDSVTTWMNTELSAADHTQAFVFDHKNLLGQNHKDNAFGSSNDANPTQQNNFFAAVANHGVRYVFSGHDHMNHRALVTSPDGLNSVQEVILQSDSTKYYTASTGFSPRETAFSDQQDKLGYYIITVDGPRVTGQYYATDHAANGDIPTNPVWALQETFGYSTNGQRFTVTRGAAYTGVVDQIAAGGGFTGTAMHLSGANTTTGTAEGGRAEAEDVNTGWATRADAGVSGASDVLYLWGMANALGSTQTDDFVLSLTYHPGAIIGDGSDGNVFIASRDANGNWVNAVDLNTGGTKIFVLGAYDASYGLGAYGIDPTTNTAWAVVNHASQFVVTPEPASLALLGLGGLLLAGGSRRRSR